MAPYKLRIEIYIVIIFYLRVRLVTIERVLYVEPECELSGIKIYAFVAEC